MEKAIHYIQQGDIAVFYMVNGKGKCRLFDIIMPFVTHFGNACFTIGFALIIMTWYWGNDIILSMNIGASLAFSHLLIHLIKHLVNRPRPNIALSNVNTYNIPLYQYSFPSGHTTAAFSVAVSVAFLIPALLFPAVFIASCVGLSRIYLGVHYPTDVIIGATIGSISAIYIKYFLAFLYGNSIII